MGKSDIAIAKKLQQQAERIEALETDNAELQGMFAEYGRRLAAVGELPDKWRNFLRVLGDDDHHWAYELAAKRCADELDEKLK